MILVFNPTKIPRSTSRDQWKEIDRWRRVTQKKLAVEVQRSIDNLITFGLTMDNRVKAREIDRIVNPPILLPSWDI